MDIFKRHPKRACVEGISQREIRCSGVWRIHRSEDEINALLRDLTCLWLNDDRSESSGLFTVDCRRQRITKGLAPEPPTALEQVVLVRESLIRVKQNLNRSCPKGHGVRRSAP